MNRITLGDARPIVAVALNMCSTDLAVVRYVNEAQARLMSKGKWVGCMQLYRVCVNNSCLVWPRQVEAIEAFSICQTPGQLRNRWYQFAGQGPGQIKQDQTWYNTMIDRDPRCAYDEIGSDTLTKKIQVSSTLAETAGAEILLQGYDQNGNWIKTQHNGVTIDGEYVSVGLTPALTTNFFTSLTGVQKPVTNGDVVLAEYETVGGIGVDKTLAYYESDETRPLYRATFLPGIEAMGSCSNDDSDSDESCTSKQITIFAKLRHIPVTNDIDWLILGNPYALKLMAQAIFKEENNLFQEARAYEAQAVKILQDELEAYQGDGEIPTLTTENPATWGPGVMNPIGTPWPLVF